MYNLPLLRRRNKDSQKNSGIINKIPVSNMLNSVCIEMKGNREAVIEGCKSIEEYDENMIRIKVKKMSLIFFGRDLEIKCMNYDSLVIEGFITSVEFSA